MTRGSNFQAKTLGMGCPNQRLVPFTVPCPRPKLSASPMAAANIRGNEEHMNKTCLNPYRRRRRTAAAPTSGRSTSNLSEVQVRANQELHNVARHVLLPFYDCCLGCEPRSQEHKPSSNLHNWDTQLQPHPRTEVPHRTLASANRIGEAQSAHPKY